MLKLIWIGTFLTLLHEFIMGPFINYIQLGNFIPYPLLGNSIPRTDTERGLIQLVPVEGADNRLTAARDLMGESDLCRRRALKSQ